MKVTAFLLTTALSMAWAAEPTLRKTTTTTTEARSLQNNYNQYQYNYNNNNNNGQAQEYNNNYNNNGGGGNYQGYENMEEYLRAQMAARTFSFTGCSTVQGNYGMQTYVTYRLCENCNSNRGSGCSNTNGDYLVTMQEFSETYREYYQDATGMEGSPFECMRVEEFQEQYYQYNGYQNGGQNYNGYNNNNNQAQQQYYQGNQQYYQNGQQQDANNYNYYNNGQEQNNEMYIGPSCSGGSKMTLGVFYNEACTYPAEGVSVKDVLGFNPSNDNMNLESCISCTNQYNYNNNNGEAEINPLCERLLERSGRCDRNEKKQTEFDSFWQDVISFVNGGGSFQQDGYDEYYEGGGDQQAAENDYYYDQNNYNNRQLQNYGYNMDYYSYQNQNTCEFVDSLPHMKSSGSWDRMKEGAASNGLSTGALICIIFVGLAVAGVAAVMIMGWFARKSVEAVGTVASMTSGGESQTPYKREEDPKVGNAVVA